MPQNPSLSAKPQQPKTELTLDEFEERVAQHFDIPRALRQALKRQESDGGRDYDEQGKVLTSPRGALGRYQVVAGTVKKYGLDPDNEFDRVYTGLRYLREKHDEVDKSISEPAARWAATLAGYHGGERQIRHINRTGGKIAEGDDGSITTRKYVDDVMKRWGRISRGESESAPVKAQTRNVIANQVSPSRAQLSQTAQPGIRTAPPNVIPKPISVIEDLESRLSVAKSKGGKDVISWIEERLVEAKTAKDIGDRVAYAKSQVADLQKRYDYAVSQLKLKGIGIFNPASKDGVQLGRKLAEAKEALNYLEFQRGAEYGRELGAKSNKSQRFVLGVLSNASDIEATIAALPQRLGITSKDPNSYGARTQRAANAMNVAANPTEQFNTAGNYGKLAGMIGTSFIPGGAVNTAIKGTTLAANVGRGALTGAGTMALTGGGSDTSSEQYLKNIGGGAVAGAVGGVGGRLAQGRSMPVRVLAESQGAGVGNVAQSLISGKRDGLLQDYATGAALGVPGGILGGKGATSKLKPPLSTEPTARPKFDDSVARDIDIRNVIGEYTKTVDNINRTITDPVNRQSAIKQAHSNYIEQRQQAARQPIQKPSESNAEPDFSQATESKVRTETVNYVRKAEKIDKAINDPAERQIAHEAARNEFLAKRKAILSSERGSQQPTVESQPRSTNVSQLDAQQRSEYESFIAEANKIKDPKEHTEELAAINEYYGIEEVAAPTGKITEQPEVAVPQRSEDAKAQNEINRMRKFDSATEQAESAGNEAQALIDKGNKVSGIARMRAQQTLLREAKKALPDSQEGIATKANIDAQVEQINSRIKELRQGKVVVKTKEVTPPTQITKTLPQTESQSVETPTQPETVKTEPQPTQSQTNKIDAEAFQNRITEISTERKQLVAQALNKREQGMTPVKERINEIDAELNMLRNTLRNAGVEQPKSKYAEGRNQILNNPETASLVESAARGNMRAKNKLYAEGSKAGLTKQNVDDLVGEYINNKFHAPRVQKPQQPKSDTISEAPSTIPANIKSKPTAIEFDEQSQSLINSLVRRRGVKPEEIPEIHRIAEQIAKADGAKSVSFNAVSDAVTIYMKSKRTGKSINEMLPQPASGQKKINHSRFGEVTVDESQTGVEVGKLRVVDKDGKKHVIQNPRTSGNRDASFTSKPKESRQESSENQVKPITQKSGESQSRTAAQTRESILVKEQVLTKTSPESELKAGDRVTHTLGSFKQEGTIEGFDKQGRPLFRDAAGDVYPVKEGKLEKLESTAKSKPDFVAEAEKRLRQNLTGERAGAGGEALIDAAIVHGYKIYRAGMGFAQWSRKMIGKYGNDIKPHLERVWYQLTGNEKKLVEAKGKVELNRLLRDWSNPRYLEKLKREREPQISIEDIPIYLNLNSKQRLAETRFRELIAYDLDRAIKTYRARFDNYINTDNARELSPDYVRSRARYSDAVYQPSSWLTVKVGEQILSEPTPPGKNPEAVVTAGGPGVGKSSSIESIQEYDDLIKSAHVIFDTTLSNPAAAEQLMNKILNAGKNPTVIAVFRDPIESYEAVLMRAMDPKSNSHTVGIDFHVIAHPGVRKTLLHLGKVFHLKPDHKKRFKILFVDNTLGKGNAVASKIDVFKEIKNERQFYKDVIILTERLKKIGAINDDVYNAAKYEINERIYREALGEFRRDSAKNGPTEQRGVRRGGIGIPKGARESKLAPISTDGQSSQQEHSSKEEVTKEQKRKPDFVLRAEERRAERQKEKDSNQTKPPTSGGTILGSGFGSLQGLFEKRQQKKPSPIERSKILQKRFGKQKTPLLETVLALRKVGLLSGVKTHLRNVGGTAAFQLAEEVSRIPATITDLAISSFTKQRTITGPSVTGIGKSLYEAGTRGRREAWQIIRKGITDEDLKKFQLNKEINSGSKIVDIYVNGIFRALSAEDRLFRVYAYRRSLEDRAKAQALTEVRQGKIKRNQVSERTKEIAAKPSADMEAGAVFDSEVAVFANDNILSSKFQKWREEGKNTGAGRAVNAAADIVVPFDKTPTNVIKRILDYSPVGLAAGTGRLANSIVKKSMTAEQQRKISQLMGRGSVGTGLIIMGYNMFLAGLATGLVEDDKSKRERDKAAGRTPGSVLIDDTWHQITGFSPTGSLIAIGATIGRDWERGVEKEKPEGVWDKTFLGAKVATKTAGKVVGDVPLIGGTQEFGRLIKGEGKASERLGRFAGSFVPGGAMVSEIGELTDKRRDATGQGFTAQIKARIPGLRQSLPEARDALGSPLEDRKTSFFDPTNTQTAKDKMRALESELVKLDIGLSKPMKKPGETESAYRNRSIRYGSFFGHFGNALAASPFYKSVDKETRKEAFDVLRREITSQMNKDDIDADRFDADSIVERAELLIEKRREKEIEKNQ